MNKIVGYILIGLPFLAAFFVGWLIPNVPNWAGLLAVGIAGVVIGICMLGIWLVDL